jgi:L-arginine dehydrogenase
MSGQKKPAGGGKKKAAALEAAPEKAPRIEHVLISGKLPPSKRKGKRVQFKIFNETVERDFDRDTEYSEYISETVAEFEDYYEDDLFNTGVFEEKFPRWKTLEKILKRGVAALRHDYEAGRFDPSGVWLHERNPAYDMDAFQPVNVWPGAGAPRRYTLRKLELREPLIEAFADLHEGRVVQPPQTLTLFPGARGDFITYLGVIDKLDIFGLKVSPFIPAINPSVTAFTLLMSMRTGTPMLLTNSMTLTAERTAATTALAVELLADKKAKILTVIGSGDQAISHIFRCEELRDWREIRIYSPHVLEKIDVLRRAFGEYRPKTPIIAAVNAEDAIKGADVVLLCTSSPKPVINFGDLSPNALVTSISTNAPKAHEIAPEALPKMDVFCDYAENTPQVAGEMIIASEAGIWSKEAVLGDLPSLCSDLKKQGAAFKPPLTGDRPVFFRSVGLGLEDVVAAHALYKKAGDTFAITANRIIEDDEL